MSELVLEPRTAKIRRRELFAPNTKRMRRSLFRSVASRRPDDVAVMITRARARGISCRRIVEWLGPPASCPPELLPLRQRLELLASVEER